MSGGKENHQVNGGEHYDRSQDIPIDMGEKTFPVFLFCEEIGEKRSKGQDADNCHQASELFLEHLENEEESIMMFSAEPEGLPLYLMKHRRGKNAF